MSEFTPPAGAVTLEEEQVEEQVEFIPPTNAILEEEAEVEPIKEDEEESGEKLTAIEKIPGIGKNAVTDFFGDISRAWTQGVEQAKSVDPSLDIFYEGDQSTDEEILKFIETNKNLAEADMESDEMKSFNKIYEEEGGGWWGFVKGAAMNPSTLSSMLVSSISGQVNSLISSEQVAAAGVAGASGGAGTALIAGQLGPQIGLPEELITVPMGAITGLMTGSMTAMETGLTFAELLQEEVGGELTKENVRAILDDPEKLHDLRVRSGGRGLAIGAIEAATMGLSKGVGGKLASAGFRAAPTVAAAATGAIEIVGGGLGEVGGRAVAGQEMDIAEIGFEAFAGLGSMPVTAGQQLLNINTNIDRVKINNQLKNTEYNNLVEAFDPSTDVTEADLNISQIKNSTKILDEQVDTQVKNTQITPEQGEAIKKNFRATQSATNKAKRANLKGENEVEVVALLKEKEVLDGERKAVNESSLTKVQEKRIKEIDARLEEVSSTITDVVKEDRKAQVAESVKFAETEGKKFGLKTEAIGSKKEFSDRFGKAEAEADGFIQDGTIYINTEVAQETGAVSVGSHELLHGILNKELKGKDATKLVQDFRNQLNEKQLSVLDSKLQAVDEQGNRLYSDDYLTQNPDEALTLFSDAIAKKEIAYDENVFTKLKDFLTPILRKAGFAKIKFETGKDVYNFLKEYNKSIKEGKLSEAISELGTEEAEAGSKKFSKTPAKIEELKSVGEDAEVIEADQVEKMAGRVAGAAWNSYGSKIPKNILEEAGITRKSYVDSAKNSILGSKWIKKWDGTRQPFNQYIANKGMLELKTLATELGVRSAEDQTTRITEDTKQIAAKEEASRDTRSDREVRQDERKGIKVREKLDPKPTLDDEGNVIKPLSPGTSTTSIYKVDKVYNFIRSKAKKQNVKGKDLKQLKGFALKEVVDMISRDNKELADSMFKKLEKNSDLNKAEMLAIQNFIFADTDLSKSSLIEGYTSEFKATGVVNKLLEKFYNKRSVRSKTGAGLNVQIKKPNISDVEFREAFGIKGKERSNWNQKVPSKKGGVSDILKGFVRNFDQVISSQEIREQLIQDGEAIESLRTLRDGIPPQLFSKSTKEKLFAAENLGKTFKELGKKPGRQEQYLANLPMFIELLSTKGITPDTAFRLAYDTFLYNKKGTKPLQLRIDIINSWKDIVDQAPKTLYDAKKPDKFQLNEYLHRSFDEQTDVESIKENLGISKEGVNFREEDQMLGYLSLMSEYFGDLQQEFDNDAKFFQYVVQHFEQTFTSAAKIGGLPNHAWKQINDVWKLVEGDKSGRGSDLRFGLFNNKTEFFNVLLKPFDTKNKLKLVKNKLVYDGEKIVTKRAPQSTAAKKKYLEEFLKDGKLSTESLINSYNDATSNQDAIIRQLKWYKENKETKADITTNDLGMFLAATVGDMTAILRSAYYIDSIALSESKKPSDYTYEHNPPVKVMQNYLVQFVNGDITEAELKQKFKDSSTSVIPDLMDKAINIRYKSSIPQDSTSRFDRYYNPTTYGKFPFEMTVYTPQFDKEGNVTSFKKSVKGKDLKQAYQDEQAAIKANKQEASDSQVISDKDMTNDDMLKQFSKTDKALDLANSLDQPIKKIRVFDFDDTLAYTKSDVLFTAPDGTTGKLNAEEFAKQGKELLDQGYKFDFSEFNKVTKGKPGPLLEIAKKIKAARGNEDLFVLTARAPEAQQAIYEFLKSQDVEFKKQNIIGLGDSTGEAKAQWLVGKAAEGYNDFYFADDAVANVAAVKESMSKLDVKSKTQLVSSNEIKFSKSLGKKLNWITDEAGNMKTTFNVNNKKYNFNLYSRDNQGTFEVEFDLDGRQDITGTGNAIKTIRTIYNGLLNAISENKNIKKIEFSSLQSETSRVKLYTTLMNSVAEKLGWETDIWESKNFIAPDKSSFDFEIVKPRKKQSAAVKKVLNVVDIKSETQQSRPKFSKNLSEDFNKIIEETEGIGREKTYSEARAKQIGSKKGKRKFWIPFSAEDMLGLIYPLLGKGKTGDAQMKFFKDNLFNPFSKAMESLAAARVQLMADFKALKENLDVPKDLQKEAFDGFTNEQAVRMYIWDSQGMEVPGASKRDVADAKKIIEGNEKLKTFAEELIKINKEDGYPKPSQSWLAGTITTDLIEGLNDVKRPKYLKQWQENVDAIFSKENLNKLEAIHGSNYREALENMLTRMKTGKNRIEGSNRMSDRVLDWINGSVGAIMFFNTRSAVLQLISSINFINWNDNNLYAAGKAFANQKQYWSDFKMLMDSDFLVDRRNGLKINVSESEIADAAKTSKNKARAVLNYILKKGFLPTQIADSFAIASGGATFYRNRVNTYLSEGMTKADAEAKAFQDFRETSEESQQSSRPDKVSQQQASSLGRVLLAFANTPMQYGRLTKRAYQDLIAGRGDRKSNISKIIYYTAVQNMIFNVLQQAITMLGFGDDEKDDEEKEEKYVDVANGMADSILRGLGIAGGAVSVAKNFLLDLYERSGRTRPEYVDSVYKLLQFSPPISSKVSKIRQAAWMFDSKKRREEIYEKGFALDNPAYEAAGKVISATTNLPVDRVYNKVNNIDAALAEDTETWESIAMLLGWPEWQIKPNKKKAKSKRSGYKSDFKKRKNRRNKKVFR